MQYETEKKKPKRYIGVFNKVRSSLAVASLIMLHNSLIYSHLTYCSSVWCLATRKYPDLLHKIQKLVRAVSHRHYLAHSAPLMQQLSILNILNVNCYRTCFLVFRALQNNHNNLHPNFNFRPEYFIIPQN